jgi:enoyl-CoA hydratase/carnithine racemase
MRQFARTRLSQMKKMIIAAVAGLVLNAGWALNLDMYAL